MLYKNGADKCTTTMDVLYKNGAESALQKWSGVVLYNSGAETECSTRVVE